MKFFWTCILLYLGTPRKVEFVYLTQLLSNGVSVFHLWITFLKNKCANDFWLCKVPPIPLSSICMSVNEIVPIYVCNKLNNYIFRRKKGIFTTACLLFSADYCYRKELDWSWNYKVTSDVNLLQLIRNSRFLFCEWIRLKELN